MSSELTRKEAWQLLKEYNKEHFHLQHAVTVEGVIARMKCHIGRHIITTPLEHPSVSAPQTFLTVCSVETALSLVLNSMDKNYQTVRELNEILHTELAGIKNITVNSRPDFPPDGLIYVLICNIFDCYKEAVFFVTIMRLTPAYKIFRNSNEAII